MGIGLDMFASGRYRHVNRLIAAAMAVAAALFIRAIWQPAYVWDGANTPEVKASKNIERPEHRRADYDVIAERDLFRPGRRMYVAPPKPQPKPVAAPQPLPKPAPRLALVGTVIRDEGQAAIMDYNGKSSYYRVGDSIEGFIIRDIRKDSVLLEREGETLRVGAPGSVPARQAMPNSPASKTTPTGQRAPVITPMPSVR